MEQDRTYVKLLPCLSPWEAFIRSKASKFFLDEDREDYIQEMNLRGLKATRAYQDSHKTALSTWIFSSIRLGHVDFIRKKTGRAKKKISFTSLESHAGSLVSIDSSMEEILDKLELQSILCRVSLSLGERSLLRLYLQGLDTKSISASLKTSEESVHSRLTALRKKLRKEWEKWK